MTALPCPTCGREPVVTERDYDVFVCCSNCYEPGEPHGVAFNGPRIRPATERAIDAWNDYVRDLVPDESDKP